MGREGLLVYLEDPHKAVSDPEAWLHVHFQLPQGVGELGLDYASHGIARQAPVEEVYDVRAIREPKGPASRRVSLCPAAQEASPQAGKAL